MLISIKLDVMLCSEGKGKFFTVTSTL